MQRSDRCGRIRRWRWTAAVAVVAVLVSGLVVASVPIARRQAARTAAAPAGTRVTEAPDTRSAVAAAGRQGSPVAVTSETNGTKMVYAQPDGTLRAVLTAEVVRVQQGGRWVGVNLNLNRRPDGSVGPQAADVDLTLSGGGGSTPLVRYGRDGKWLSLSWPGPLPVPVLDGPTATYREVLPGVDLVMRAEVDGYTQNLVVKDRAAAGSPALARLRLGLTTGGLTVRAAADGSLTAVDGSGGALFEAPPSAMWDSGSKRSVAAVSVGGGALTLVPDRKLLTDPGTRYPVTVDPNWAAPARTGWAKVFSGLPNSTEWNGGPDGGEAKSGLCWPSAACNGIGVARTYFQYDTGFLAGKDIISAAVNMTVVHSPSCDMAGHNANDQLFLANGTIGPGTTWNNAPNGVGLEQKYADVVYSGCDGYKPLGFNVTGNVRAGGISTYFVKAVDEGDGYAWRRLDANVTNLVVNYNTAPNAPYELGTDPPLAAPCRWCGGVSYVGDQSIRLTTRLSDPDGDQLHPIWDITGGGSTEHRDSGPKQTSGASFSTSLDLKSRDGQKVSWTVWGSDGARGGPVGTGPGFVVDEVGVPTAPGVSGRLYKEDNAWHGGVGVSDQFTFDAAGVKDVDHYLYGFQDPPSAKVDATALGGPATVTLAPPGDGPRNLYVQSVDRAGHRSPSRVYHFYVRSGNGPHDQWAFEGNAKDGAFLGDNDGTLNGDASYTPGAVGAGLKLAGAGSVTAANAVRTDTSFSVSAWVRVDSGGFARAAVSQDGTTNSGFDLWYRPENGGHWVFGVTQTDTAPAGPIMATSPATAQVGVWTQLTGVYDAPARQVRLYVNGDPAATAVRPAGQTPWQAGGSLRIGQTLWNGQLTDNWVGLIDEVQVYDRVLTDAEVHAAVVRDNVQVGHWKLDDEVGNKTAVNDVQSGAMGVLSGGVSFSADAAAGDTGGGGATFDGTGSITTGRPEFRTDQSFSVSAWVWLDSGSAPRAALSQDGTGYAGFDLWYRPENGGKWVFGMALADGGSPGATMAWSAAPAQIHQWTLLTGVYDAPAKQLRLYVDDKLSGTATQQTPAWNATGPFQIGRSMWQGNPAVDYWLGKIDDVRAYSRVLSLDEVHGLLTQSDVSVGEWKFDGDATDSSGRKVNGTLNGGVDWAGGQSSSPDPTDLAVHFNGIDGYVTAPHAVDTSQSFSVAAWVRLDKLGDHYGVVTQDGTHSSAFRIEAEPGGQWSFTMYGQDINGGGTIYDTLGGAAQPGVWTHLAGVYDAGSNRLLLYVNGVLVASRAHSNAWNYPTGKVEIGRSQWNGAPVDYLPGAIDDVTIYSRALYADEVHQMAGQDLNLVHEWTLDEPSGTNAADAVGGLPGTLTGGASFTAGRVGNAVALDGVDDSVSTTAVDVRTDASFTVSAYVYLPDYKCDLNTYTACRMDAITLDGANTSKFRLGHIVDNDQNQLGSWIFEMPESDSSNAFVTKAAVATLPPDTDHWVHLVGVYDSQAKQTWLYVDGSRVGDGTLNTVWNATGSLVIGRGKADGKATDYWAGSVDDVRMYTGVLDQNRISALYHSYPAEHGPDTLPAADAGQWEFDEGTGTTVADATGNGHAAALKGGTGWIGGRAGSAAWLDGTSGYAETAGPVVTTSASFSVTAWAYLSAGGGSTNATVVAQDGDRVSSFAVVYNAGNNRWSVIITGADQDDPSTVELDSVEPAAVGEWSHLAVVYDATLRQLRLYVNGTLSTAKVGVPTWNATGPFTIGRGKWNGANVTFFPRGIDDVRAYSEALSDGQVRRIHDDGGAPLKSTWRFDDGTGRDYSGFRNDTAKPDGGVTFVPGVSGTAIQLDGSTGKATADQPAVDMRDSFTVSAWARLSRLDQVGTVLGQDGSRNSGFVLQYRPALQRWVFGAPTNDSDGAPLVYAASLVPPKAGEWTHLTGVYDYAARQLRLYVNGQLVGAQGNVALWAATGKFTIGRGKLNGSFDNYFPGTIDEVVTNQGAVPDAQIAVRGGWAVPAGGQLGRYVNAAGDHYTGSTDAPVRDGYHFEATLGMLVPGPRDNTRTLYACTVGGDGFTSTDPACEKQTVVGPIGSVYNSPPINVATIPVYRCDTGPDHFDSRQSGCGGATNEMVLGYTLAYAPLVRYNFHIEASDHLDTVDGPPPGYLSEGVLGLVALTAESGTQQVLACRSGTDSFTSTDATCDGKTVVGTLGQLWTAAPTVTAGHPVYRCLFGTDQFVSPYQDCEGQTVEGQLGYLLTAVPDILPIFPVTS